MAAVINPGLDRSGDELFTDAYKYKVVDDIYYHIEGKFIKETSSDDYDIGANPSAEEAGEELAANVTTGVNVALAQRLVAVGTTKSEYKKEIKVYVKNLMTKIAKTDAKRVEFLKSNLQPVIKKWIEEFDDFSLFKGESMDDEGTYILCKYPDDCQIGCKVDLYVLKDAVEEEKY